MTAAFAIDELLKPIPGENPGGANIRYVPGDATYTRLKDARRPNEDERAGGGMPKLPDGDIIELASRSIAERSKDLQLAVWLTDSLIRRDGFSGLRQGLDLMRGMIEQFWDWLYPEADDGDLEMRAAPLDWLGSYFEMAKEPCPILSARSVPLTLSGLTWLDYQQSQGSGNSSSVKSGEFDTAFAATPRDFYEERAAELAGCLESLEALDKLCTEKFGSVAPSFTRLRATLEQIHRTVDALLQRKPPAEPAATRGESPARSTEGMPEAAVATAVTGLLDEFAGEITGIEPSHKQEAYVRIAAAARYLRRLDPTNPAAYLLVRMLRWSEIRARAGELDSSLLVAPGTELRTRMKTLAANSRWTELLELTESAAAAECGRGWLDLHRYAVTACEELGYTAAAGAIRSELACLLEDYPGLVSATLLDDTGAANPDTAAWLKKGLRKDR